MKRFQRFTSGTLVLLLAAAAPLSARAAAPKHGPPLPVPLWQQSPPAPTHPQKGSHRTSQRKPQRQEQPVYQHSRQDPRYSRNGHRTVWQQHRARSWETEHRGWDQRGGYRGHRIPEQQYHVRFGPTHQFRLYLYPVSVVSGYIHFQYGGFGFSVVDPVPEYWSDRWYDDDDMYIVDAGDGYYMHNRRHPQDRIAISVTLR